MKRFKAYGLTTLDIVASDAKEAWDKAQKSAPFMWKAPIIERLVEVDSNGKPLTELPEHDE